MIFKCKNCGGNVVYSPERKKMFCPFCESEDSEERQDSVIDTGGSRSAGKQNGSGGRRISEKGNEGMPQLWR